MFKFDKLFKKIIIENNINTEGLFTGDNNFSVNISGNNIDQDIDVSALPLQDSSNATNNQINKTELNQSNTSNQNDTYIHCEVCGKIIDPNEADDFSSYEPDFQHDHICGACAEEYGAKQNDKYTNGEIPEAHEVVFELNRPGSYVEEYIVCPFCNQLVPLNDTKETDMGSLCSDCINSLDSRGQEYVIYHNRY